MIGIFGDQNLGDGRFGRNTALDQPRGSRSLDDNRLTGAAGIFETARYQNAELELSYRHRIGMLPDERDTGVQQPG